MYACLDSRACVHKLRGRAPWPRARRRSQRHVDVRYIVRHARRRIRIHIPQSSTYMFI
jgi:hypothetical protein